MLVAYLFDVVFQEFGVASHDRAVVAVLLREELFFLQGDARIENTRCALLDELHDVAVAELRRIADRLRRDRRHAQGIDLFGGRRRQHDAEPQLGEKREPERVVFVHVQHTRNAHHAARRLGGFQGGVMLEQALQLVGIEIRQGIAALLHTGPPLAAVSGNEFRPILEGADRE